LNDLEEALPGLWIVARTRTTGPAKNLAFHRLLQSSLPRQGRRGRHFRSQRGCHQRVRYRDRSRRQSLGATIGLGAEFSFAPNWSAGVEYDHLFIGNYTTTFNNTTGGVFSTDRIRGDGDIFTVRINYRWAARSFPNIGEHRSLLI
jgi:opacity protein-like surface antigen